MRDVTQYFDLVAKIIELSPAVDSALLRKSRQKARRKAKQ